MKQIYYDDKMEPVVSEGEVEKKKETAKNENHESITEEKKDGDGKVSIIILCWNQVRYTKICIDSIKEHTDPDIYQLIVVDQGSKDKTLDFLVENLGGENDIIIHNKTNRGFSGGNNQAIKLAEHEYVLCINNDIRVLEDNWLDCMFEGMAGADLVGATCQKVEPDYRKNRFEHVGNGHESEAWSYMEGWCLFSTRDNFLRLNGFDMQFNPAYSEDADLSFRIKEMGGKIKAVNVPVRHFGSKSKKKIDEESPNQSDVSNSLLFNKWIDKNSSAVNVEELRLKTRKLKKESILIKRKGAMGDVLMLTPIIRELKKIYPNSLLAVETNSPDILTNNPYIDHAETYIPGKDYSIVLEPRYEKDPGGNAIDVMAKQCGIDELESRKMEIYLTPDNIRWAKNKLDTTKRYIAFHTGRTWKSREWPVRRFKEVALHFMNKGYDVVELGDRETVFMDIGNDCRGCSIKQTASLIKESIAFVGIDSSCANIAKALNTPAFIVYGCVDPSTRIADAVEFPIWIDDLECRGCRNKTSAEYVECTQPEIYCLTEVHANMVIEKMEEYFQKHFLRRKVA